MKVKLNQKNIRYFNQIKLVDDGSNLIKSYTGDDEYYKNKFYDEIIWMLKMEKYDNSYTPKILDFSTNRQNLWIKQSVVNQKTIHDFFIESNLKLNWVNVVEAYIDFFKKVSKIRPHFFIETEWKDAILDFYLHRTLNNIEKLKNNEKLFKIFFKKSKVTINGIEYPSLKRVVEFLNNKLSKLKNNTLNKKDIFNILVGDSLSLKKRICFSHLDLVFGNVFYDSFSKKIKVIDPRGSFANSKEYGDIYYDLAKIYQCVYGLYDFIAEDLFTIKNNENSLIYSIKQPKNINKVKKAFEILFQKYNLKLIQLVESIQFFSMTPAHNDNVERQMVQICIGIEHFSQVVGEEIHK